MLVDESLRDELARAITHPSKLLIEAAFQKQRAAKQALYDHHRTLLFEPIGRKAPQFCGPLGVLASSILPRHSVSPVVVHGAIREIVQLYYIGSAVREWIATATSTAGSAPSRCTISSHHPSVVSHV